MAVPIGARGEPIGDVQMFARDVRAWQSRRSATPSRWASCAPPERGASGPVECCGSVRRRPSPRGHAAER